MGRRRVHAISVGVALWIASCGAAPSLAEYAEEVEQAVADMRVRIIATDDSMVQPAASVAEFEAIWRERVAAREEFLAALEAIDPAEEATAIHAAAQDVVRRLADAEAAVGDQVGDYEQVSQLNGLGSTAAYRQFLEVNEESTNICLAAQERFDDTKQREIFADMPWIASEMKEVIEVVFGCVPDEG